MYCQLGYLAFERREYVEGLEATHKFDFVEQPHVEGKPGLQAVGDGLDTYQLDMVFHHLWCDPAASIDKLREVAARKQAQALTFGDGTYLGKFVVTEVTQTWRHTRPDGALLYAVLRVQLKEFVDPEPLVTSRKRAVTDAPAVKIPAKPTASTSGTASKPTTAPKPVAKPKTGTPPFTLPYTSLPHEVPAADIVRN